jgi:hypothetical protein
MVPRCRSGVSRGLRDLELNVAEIAKALATVLLRRTLEQPLARPSAHTSSQAQPRRTVASVSLTSSNPNAIRGKSADRPFVRGRRFADSALRSRFRTAGDEIL